MLFITVPGYISRSVAGSYDNEGIAIFALQFTYFLWVGIHNYRMSFLKSFDRYVHIFHNNLFSEREPNGVKNGQIDCNSSDN